MVDVDGFAEAKRKLPASLLHQRPSPNGSSEELAQSSTAVELHSDEHCSNTISIGLNGDKVWELSPIDTPQTHPGFANGMFGQFGYRWLPLYEDGFYGSDKWKPVFKTTVRQGEALIFPPLLIHRTFAARGPDGSTSSSQTDENLRESCTNSLTMQFDYPLPSAYLRSYWPRIFASPSSSKCVPMWHRAMALDADLLSDLAAHFCGSYSEMQLRFEAAGDTLLDTRDSDTAIAQAHINGVMQEKGNATHFSMIGELYEDASQRTTTGGNWRVETSVKLLAELDAAHALPSFDVQEDSDGNADAVLEKEDFYRLIVRLNSARDKHSRDLRLFRRRSPIAMPLWIPLSFACFGERFVLRIFPLKNAPVTASKETFQVAFHDLDGGVGFPPSSTPICRSFYNLDKWLLSGKLFYLYVAIMYLLVIVGTVVLLVLWWRNASYPRKKGTMSTGRSLRQRRRK